MNMAADNRRHSKRGYSQGSCVKTWTIKANRVLIQRLLDHPEDILVASRVSQAKRRWKTHGSGRWPRPRSSTFGMAFSEVRKLQIHLTHFLTYCLGIPIAEMVVRHSTQ